MHVEVYDMQKSARQPLLDICTFPHSMRITGGGLRTLRPANSTHSNAIWQGALSQRAAAAWDKRPIPHRPPATDH